MSESRATAARQAYICMDGWGGRHDYAVLVVGETPKRYRVRSVMKDTPLAGRRRYLQPGQEALVPKYAVRFPNETQ